VEVPIRWEKNQAAKGKMFRRESHKDEGGERAIPSETPYRMLEKGLSSGCQRLKLRPGRSEDYKNVSVRRKAVPEA